MDRGAVVRHEHLGPLIWSERFHSYYMLRDEADSVEARALIELANKNREHHGLGETIR